MAKKVNINKDKDKYHFDIESNIFFTSDDLPFDAKIHPRLRHLHKNSSFLVCSKCKRVSHSGLINDDCRMAQPNGKSCDGLMLSNA